MRQVQINTRVTPFNVLRLVRRETFMLNGTSPKHSNTACPMDPYDHEDCLRQWLELDHEELMNQFEKANQRQ